MHIAWVCMGPCKQNPAPAAGFSIGSAAANCLWRDALLSTLYDGRVVGPVEDLETVMNPALQAAAGAPRQLVMALRRVPAKSLTASLMCLNARCAHRLCLDRRSRSTLSSRRSQAPPKKGAGSPPEPCSQ